MLFFSSKCHPNKESNFYLIPCLFYIYCFSGMTRKLMDVQLGMAVLCYEVQKLMDEQACFY